MAKEKEGTGPVPKDFLEDLEKERTKAVESLTSFREKLTAASKLANNIARDERYGREERKAALYRMGREMNMMYDGILQKVHDIKETIGKSEVFSTKVK
jgi:hypothetical protein